MRFVLGPAFDIDVTAPEPPPPPPSAKPDPTIEFLGASEGTARFSVGAYDPSVYASLVEILVYLVESGTEIIPDAEWFVASSYPKGSVDVNGAFGGFGVALPLPDVPPGAYLGQVVYGFAE